MFEAFASFILLEHLNDRSFVPPIGTAGYPRQLDPDRQPFPCSDGAISIVAYTDGAWPRIFKLLGEPGFLDDPRFATPKDRFLHSAFLYRRMAELTKAFTVADLLAKLREADIPAQPVRDLDDVLNDEHLQAVGFYRTRQHPSEGGYIDMAPPVLFSDAPMPPASFPPRVDEHGGAIRAAVIQRTEKAG